jgi:hypothetical protein
MIRLQNNRQPTGESGGESSAEDKQDINFELLDNLAIVNAVLKVVEEKKKLGTRECRS